MLSAMIQASPSATRKRKEARPAEILEAAFAEFVKNGFSATRIDDVARRAGVAKGTIYLYYPSKEALFEAVVRQSLAPHYELMDELHAPQEASTEALIRGLFLATEKAIIRSGSHEMLRLLMAECKKFPDLVAHYHREVGMAAVEKCRMLIERGIERGEFVDGPIRRFPELLVAATVQAMVGRIMMEPFDPAFDGEALIETYLELLLKGLKA